MYSGSEPRSSDTDTSKIIWLRLPYAGHIGESIVNRLVRKLTRCFREPVRFKILYRTKKLSSFCSKKDPTSLCLKSHVIYKLTCPDCNAEHIGKTDRCLRVRLEEHSSDHNSAMFEHLHGCKAFKPLFSLNILPEVHSPELHCASLLRTICCNISARCESAHVQGAKGFL